MRFLALGLMISLPAFAVAPATPSVCKPVVKSKLGDHLRETVWEITHMNAKLNAEIDDHRKHCAGINKYDLTESRQLSELERIGARTRKIHQELLDLVDEYDRTMQVAAEAAHLLRENDCEDKLQDQRKSLGAQYKKKSLEVARVLQEYCR